MSMIKHSRAKRSSSQGRSQASLARSSAIMASGTLVSRVLGMVRNALIVMALGATGSGAADAFNTANNLPTYLYNMMIGGILNAILVPQIVQALRRRNGEEVVNRLLTAAATLMLVVTCIATAAAPLIFAINASSLAQGQWQMLSFAFAFWFMPQVFFYGLYALWGQVLNARSSFGPYMWSPVLNNIISIASILAYLHIYGRYTTGQGPEVWDVPRITLIGATTTLGIAVQALVLYIPLVRSGFRPRIIFGVRGLGLGKTVKVALWALAGVGVASLSNWITSNLGSYAVTASEQPEYADVIVPSTTMWLNGYLIYMLPQSLVVTSIITALFTRMSEKAAAGDAAGVREDLSLGLRSAGVFTVLATAGICVLAVPALQLFTPSITLPEAQASAPMLIALALGIVPQGIWFGTQRVMLAYSDTKRLLLADVVVGVVPVVLCVMAYFMAPANHWMAWAGAANTLSQIGGCLVVIPMLRSHLPSLDGRKIITTHLRLVIAVAPPVIAGIVLNLILGNVDADSSLTKMLAAFGHICIVATVMSLVYLLMGRVVRIEEIAVAFRPFSRILSTIGRRLPGGLGRVVLAIASWLSPPEPTTTATAQMDAVQTPAPPPPPQSASVPSAMPSGPAPHPAAHGAVGYTAGGTHASPSAPPPPPQAQTDSWDQPGQMGQRSAGGRPAQAPTGYTQDGQPVYPLAPAPPAPSQAVAPPPPTRADYAADASHRSWTTGHIPANTPGSIPPSLPASIPPSRVATGQSAPYTPHASAHTSHITPVWSPQTVTMGSTGSDGQPSQGRRRMSEATPIGSGRYGLLGTLSTTLPRIVRHRGVDTILDREVTILVLTDATLHRHRRDRAGARRRRPQGSAPSEPVTRVHPRSSRRHDQGQRPGYRGGRTGPGEPGSRSRPLGRRPRRRPCSGGDPLLRPDRAVARKAPRHPLRTTTGRRSGQALHACAGRRPGSGRAVRTHLEQPAPRLRGRGGALTGKLGPGGRLPRVQLDADADVAASVVGCRQRRKRVRRGQCGRDGRRRQRCRSRRRQRSPRGPGPAAAQWCRQGRDGRPVSGAVGAPIDTADSARSGTGSPRAYGAERHHRGSSRTACGSARVRTSSGASG